MLPPSARAGFGLLARAFLANERGEPAVLQPDPPPLPHHQVCPVCGFDRWDGHSEHPRAGTRFATACRGRGHTQPVYTPSQKTSQMPENIGETGVQSPVHPAISPSRHIA